MKSENIEKIISLIDSNVDITSSDYLRNQDFESIEDIESLLEEAFDVTITYYGTAMEYLMRNDCSLKSSLQLAKEQGYTLDNLSSEDLASILASKNVREEWWEVRDKVEELLEELLEEEADEEENEEEETEE